MVGPQVTHNVCPTSHDPLLEQLTELREILTYNYQFITGVIKDTDEWTDEEVQRVRSGGTHTQKLCPCGVRVCLPPGVDVFTSVEALWTPHLWDSVEASSCRHAQILTPFPAPLISLEKGMGWAGAANAKVLTMALPLW